jgi:hypothetical protein
MNNNLAIATVLFIVGQTITWLSSYSQFFWQWAKDHTFLIAVTTAIPSALCFIYGLKYAYRYFESGWAPRFYIFSLSFVVMPFLFWYFMGEKFFTMKNMLSNEEYAIVCIGKRNNLHSNEVQINYLTTIVNKVILDKTQGDNNVNRKTTQDF